MIQQTNPIQRSVDDQVKHCSQRSKGSILSLPQRCAVLDSPTDVASTPLGTCCSAQLAMALSYMRARQFPKEFQVRR
jgi:hypothetical protein